MTKSHKTASLLLAEYEQLNHDLPRTLRRQLAVFVLAPRVPKKALEALYDRPLGQTPYKHRSWLWWASLRTSGLSGWWEDIAGAHNSGEPLSPTLQRMRDSDPERWETFGRRMGCPDGLRISNYCRGRDGDMYWTRGGGWHRRNNFTRIIVFGEHIERDNYEYNRYARKLGPTGAQLLEKELHAHIDEEALLYPDAIFAAVHYVRNRLPQLTGYKKRAAHDTASWFFQTFVPHECGGWEHYREDYKRPLKRGAKGNYRRIEWFPTE